MSERLRCELGQRSLRNCFKPRGIPSKLNTTIIVIVLQGTSPGEPSPVLALVTTLNPFFTEKNDANAKAEQEQDDRNGGDAARR